MHFLGLKALIRVFYFDPCSRSVCIDCTVEDAKCWRGQSSSPIQSKLDNNVLQFLPGLQEEEDCMEACSREAGCSFYTHHSMASTPAPPSLGNASSCQI